MTLLILQGARTAARAVVASVVLACGTTPASARVVHIDLHATASAAGEDVVLSDVATISNADEATLARLATLDVGRVSADGKVTFVDRAALARWVQARTGVLSSDIAWGGAARCSVRIAQASAVARVASEPARALAGVAPPAVAHGTLASLRSVSGAIALESRVEILDDGAVGQDVHVRLPGASEAILARVTAPGRVEVTQ